MPLGRRQRIEILKAILRDADLLILDEPTSNLAPAEVADLLTILRCLRSEVKGIIFISHKLPEVLDVCDRVVVLRTGRVVGRAAVAGASQGSLAEMMIGRDVTASVGAPVFTPPAAPRLTAADLTATGLGSLTFTIGSGEILGGLGSTATGRSNCWRRSPACALSAAAPLHSTAAS